MEKTFAWPLFPSKDRFSEGLRFGQEQALKGENMRNPLLILPNKLEVWLKDFEQYGEKSMQPRGKLFAIELTRSPSLSLRESKSSQSAG